MGIFGKKRFGKKRAKFGNLGFSEPFFDFSIEKWS